MALPSPMKGLYRDSPSCLHKGLGDLWFDNSVRYSDVQVQLSDGRTVGCHQVILAACSPRLASILSQGQFTNSQLYLAGADSEALYSILRFMYTGECEMCETSVVALSDVATKLGVACLVQACEQFVQEVGITDWGKLVTILNQATGSESLGLAKSILRFQDSRFREVIGHPSFQRLSEQAMRQFISFQQELNKPLQLQLDAINAWCDSNPAKLTLAQSIMAPAAAAAAAAAAAPTPAPQPMRQCPAPDVARPSFTMDVTSRAAAPVLAPWAAPATQIAPAAPPITVPVHPGQTVHAALAAAGIHLSPQPGVAPTSQAPPADTVELPFTLTTHPDATSDTATVMNPTGSKAARASDDCSSQHHPAQLRSCEASGMHYPDTMDSYTVPYVQQQAQQQTQTMVVTAANGQVMLPAGMLKPGYQLVVVEPVPARGFCVPGQQQQQQQAHQPPPCISRSNPNEALSAPASMATHNQPHVVSKPLAAGCRPAAPTTHTTSSLPGPGTYHSPGSLTASRCKVDKGDASQAVKVVCCIDNCLADLSHLREYHQRFRICEYHLKIPSVLKDGVLQRFCQQCGRFHVLSEFDGTRRSCRAQLERHNARRRKRVEIVEDEVTGDAGLAEEGGPSLFLRPADYPLSGPYALRSARAQPDTDKRVKAELMQAPEAATQAYP